MAVPAEDLSGEQAERGHRLLDAAQLYIHRRLLRMRWRVLDLLLILI
jgi:hypothetical protein